MTPIKSVLVYGGHQGGLLGPYGMSVDKHLSMFEKVNALRQTGWDIKKIDGEDIAQRLQETSSENTLLVVPAGESSSLDAAFSKETIEAIRKGMSLGMRLYATCGSAYWLAKTRIWNDRCLIQPEKIETIKKPGRVNLFEGTAIGPLSPYPGEVYSTAFFHEATLVKAAKKAATVLLSGGGTFFLDQDSHQEVKTIVTYSDEALELHQKPPSWKAAVISCRYGAGKAILSMIHPGYGREDIEVEAYRRAFPSRNDDWAQIRDSLSSEEERLSLIAEILQEFEC